MRFREVLSPDGGPSKVLGLALLAIGSAWLAFVALAWLSTARTVPLVNVRWAEGTTESQRGETEHVLSLARYPRQRESTWSYFVLADDPSNLRAIVTNPFVEDTAFIDRATFMLDDPPRASFWLAERWPILRGEGPIALSLVACLIGVALLRWRVVWNGIATHWRHALLLCLIVVAFAMVWHRNDTLSRGTSFRYRVPAVIARSQIVLDSPRDYTGYDAARRIPTELDASEMPFVQQELSRDPDFRAHIYYQEFEGKGIVDYARFAYQLFGIHDRSLLSMFFVVLAVGLLVFLVDHGSDVSHVFLTLAFLSAVYVTIFVIPISDQLDNLHDPRLFAVLSMIPMFHLVASVFRSSVSPLSVACVTLQTLIILFVYHARSSAQWQILCIVAAAGLWCVIDLWRPIQRQGPLFRRIRAVVARRAWPALILVLGLGALNGYKHITYHPAYFGTYLEDHVVWHSAFMGYAVHPELSREYKLPVISDEVVMKAAQRYLIVNDDQPRWDAAFGGAYNIGGFENINWTAYDKVVRDLYMEVLKTHPLEALEAHLVSKPRLMLRQMLWTMGGSSGRGAGGSASPSRSCSCSSTSNGPSWIRPATFFATRCSWS